MSEQFLNVDVPAFDYGDGMCQNCKQNPATTNWTGEGGVIAFVHGAYQRWCDVCCVTAQLEHARAMAAQIPDLEAKLAEFDRKATDV
jgi:hypothetical protein